MQQGGMYRNMQNRRLHRLPKHIRLMGNSHPRTAIPQQKNKPNKEKQIQKMETRTIKSSQARQYKTRKTCTGRSFFIT